MYTPFPSAHSVAAEAKHEARGFVPLSVFGALRGFWKTMVPSATIRTAKQDAVEVLVHACLHALTLGLKTASPRVSWVAGCLRRSLFVIIWLRFALRLKLIVDLARGKDFLRSPRTALLVHWVANAVILDDEPLISKQSLVDISDDVEEESDEPDSGNQSPPTGGGASDDEAEGSVPSGGLASAEDTAGGGSGGNSLSGSGGKRASCVAAVVRKYVQRLQLVYGVPKRSEANRLTILKKLNMLFEEDDVRHKDRVKYGVEIMTRVFIPSQHALSWALAIEASGEATAAIDEFDRCRLPAN